MTPHITSRPAAYPPATGRNSHIPYGIYVCPDGTEVLFCRNYTPLFARNADGSGAQRVPLLSDGNPRWVEYQRAEYFFRSGNHPRGRLSKPWVKANVAHGEMILEKFSAGDPVLHFAVPPPPAPQRVNTRAR